MQSVNDSAIDCRIGIPNSAVSTCNGFLTTLKKIIQLKNIKKKVFGQFASKYLPLNI